MFNTTKRTRYFDIDLLEDYKLEMGYNENGSRYYITPDGQKYPSVTTVLSKLNKDGIDQWKARVGAEEAAKTMQQASTRGTAVHLIAENYLKNDEAYLKGHMPANVDTFKKIQPFLDKHVGVVRANEISLYSHELRTAGKCDLIAEVDGVLHILDFKTSKRRKPEAWIKNYFLQCTAYALMLYERTGIMCEHFTLLIATDEDGLQVVTKRTADYTEEVRYVFKGHTIKDAL